MVKPYIEGNEANTRTKARQGKGKSNNKIKTTNQEQGARSRARARARAKSRERAKAETGSENVSRNDCHADSNNTISTGMVVIVVTMLSFYDNLSGFVSFHVSFHSTNLSVRLRPSSDQQPHLRRRGV